VTVGSGFPEEFLKVQIRRRLKPRAVIKLYRKMDDGPFRINCRVGDLFHERT